MRILVIEDSRFLRLAIERTLGRAGHVIVAVGDGGEGLRCARESKPDAIVLDMMLPTLEGTAVLRQLKADPVTQEIPVIILSGLSQKNEQKMIATGAAAYFEKSRLDLSGDGAELVKAVQNACRKTD